MRNSEPDRSQERLEHLKAVAKEAGVKLTHQRPEMFRELAGTEEHPDAEITFRAVRQRLPTVDPHSPRQKREPREDSRP